jgi:hypothetical protein
MIEIEAEQGRKQWADEVAGAGFDGDASALWDAMVTARETNGFGLPPNKLAEDSNKLAAFTEAVRAAFGGPVPDAAIKAGLLVMPRPCAW